MKNLLPLVLAFSLSTAALPAAAQSVDQTAFKAAMIYNIARFATWPPPRFADASAPVILCVAPGDPLADDLARLEGQPVKTRRLDVRITASFGPACHLALIPSDMPAARIETLNSQGVLTIGERPGFSRAGAVGLVQIGRQVRFEVNTRAAGQGGVVLSSQLLRLAIAVK